VGLFGRSLLVTLKPASGRSASDWNCRAIRLNDDFIGRSGNVIVTRPSVCAFQRLVNGCSKGGGQCFASGLAQRLRISSTFGLVAVGFHPIPRRALSDRATGRPGTTGVRVTTCRAVLAHRAVSDRARDDRGGREGRLHPVHPPAAVEVGERAGEQWPPPARDVGAGPAGGVPGPGRGSTRRPPRSLVCCSSSPNAFDGVPSLGDPRHPLAGADPVSPGRFSRCSSEPMGSGTGESRPSA
jgi:hypothetical protein